MTTRTRKIAGHEITLTAGRRYLASRPMADGRRLFDVFITDITEGVAMPGEGRSLVIEGLDIHRADRLLHGFNIGVSFAGRVW